MNSKSRFRTHTRRCCKRFRRNKNGIRTVAMSLAVIMVLSVFGANMVSIVNLLMVNAAHNTSDYYTADLTLYDYYTDSELNGGNDNNTYKSGSGDNNKNKIFNQALYESGYATKAGTWGSLAYYPLYLGLQYISWKYDDGSSIRDEAHNYSLMVNSQASENVPAAAQGLVDDTLYNGELTQGNGLSKVPYFDEDFLTSKFSTLLTNAGSSIANKTPGRVQSGFKFNFVKNNDTGYYEYDSLNMGLNYADKVFTASDNGTTKLDMINQSAFFPWRYLSSAEDKQNFGYGAKFEIPFTMSNTGTTVDMQSGEVSNIPIQFNFSGDDDVWVFIDDKLVLDIGGAHGRVDGHIYFSKADPKAVVSRVKNDSFNSVNVNAGSFSTNKETDLKSVFNEIGLYDDATKTHVLRVFYVERGSIESNCMISFNFQVADSVSVHNTVDTSNVNEWFAQDTRDVAEKEGVEYLLASNGTQSGLTSPDAGKETNEPVNPVTNYTVSFTEGYNSYEVRDGTTIKLPDGYRLSKPGYYLGGWKLVGKDTLYNTYKVTSNVTFTPHWVKIPITLEDVPKPLLIYISANGTKNSSSHDNKISDLGGNKYFANLTGSSELQFWIQTGNKQHPGYENDGYSFNNQTGDSGVENGNTLKLKENNVYSFNITGDSSSTLYRYSPYAASFGTISNSTVTDFITKYNDFYEALVKANANIKAHDTAGSNVASEVAAYEKALKTYKEATISTNLTQAIDELNTAVPDVTYTYSYAYSSTKTEFYVYSASGTPTVAIANASSYSGLPSAAISVAKFSNLPVGAVDTTKYPAANYYKVTVPKYIVETKTPDSGTATTANISTQVNVNSNASSVKASDDIESMSGDYPCYYVNDGAWRDITAPAVSYSYSSTQKVFWVYSKNGAPTVKYSSPIANTGLSEGTATLVENNVVQNYYGYKVPATVNKSDGTSQAVNLTINGDATTLPTSGAKCYFKTGTSDGWHNLVTVVVEEPLGSIYWWGGSSYIWVSNANNATSPLKTTLWADDACLMTRIGDTHVHYGYVPSNSSDAHIFRNSKNSPINATYQSVDVTGLTSDKFLDYSGQDGEGKVKYNISAITSTNNASYYQYTATYKASSLFGTANVSMMSIEPKAIAEISVADEGSTSTSATTESAIADESTTTASSTETSAVEDSNETTNESDEISGQSDEPASRGAAENGQFTNTKGAGKYDIANGVNFKLFNASIDESQEESEQSVVRKTDTTNGGFYLLFGQTAKFTYQFRRKTGLKIAQTGSAWRYDYTTKTDASNNPIFVNTVNPETSNGKASASANSKENGLYNRYRTSWTLTDEAGGEIVSSRKNYSVYLKNGEYTSSNGTPTNAFKNSTYSGQGAIYFDNILSEANGNVGIHLIATYTNEVITGDLSIVKALTATAEQEIEDYRNKDSANANYNPEFKFKLNFSNVFGGDSASKTYQGTNAVYYITNGTNYLTGDDMSSTTNKSAAARSIAGSGTDAGVIKINYNQIKAGYKIVVEGIPVETKYQIAEIMPEAESGQPIFKLDTVVEFAEGNSDVSTNKQTLKATNNTTDFSKIKATLGNAVETNVGVATGPLAQYYAAETNAADFSVTVTNDIENAYIMITKSINELYYGKNDKPNELLPAGTTLIPGATTGTDDPNGYESGTKAEQTFIFKIVEHNRSNDSVTNTFYETISFAADSSKSGDRYVNSRLIKVDPTKYYTIEEIDDWSWKYNLTDATVTKESGSANNVNSNKIAYVYNFDSTVSLGSITTNCGAEVTFKNDKHTDGQEDIEGDTSLKENMVVIKKTA